MQAQLWVYNCSGLVRYKDTALLWSLPISDSYNLLASSSWMTPEPWGVTQYSNAGTWTYGLLLSCTFRQNYIFNINLRSWSFSTKWFLLLWFLSFYSRISRSCNQSFWRIFQYWWHIPVLIMFKLDKCVLIYFQQTRLWKMRMANKI